MADWEAQMEEANSKWLAKRAGQYPFRADIPLPGPPGALSIANELNVRFLHCKLPRTGVLVFAFTSEADREKFTQALEAKNGR